jgi:hypothetical protein
MTDAPREIAVEMMSEIGRDNIGHQPGWVRDAVIALARRALSQAGGELLDKAWENVNALGGDDSSPNDGGYCLAIDRALREIEKLGGRDPLTRSPLEREIASETEWRRGSEVERQVIYRDGTIETEFAPDTPQSVPTCTCSKHPLWDGYDGDCPIHGWFEPVAPDTPQSIPAAGDDELAVRAERDRLQDEINTILEIKDKQVNALVERVSVLESERDKLKEACDGYLAHAANLRGENAKLVERVSVLERALQAIADGIPRPTEGVTIYRKDGKISKHDKCKHDLFMWEGCDECISDFARAALRTSE